ncbi:ABC transporter substrate-binding protein [Paenibacillus tundrae]|uniref:Multiple sugar transport system substrate-binding protein n=1 Tax=Paenibacillus tundrae TaxID=528187 RepID=A0ABT9WK15_9BACL|nr:extracellular solute-binding protein [Paenibacillus tundrae]MDQ0173579.1 multiple sugar transport system substrate-binding protein [Paenibacillus tundrae]
MKHNVLQKTMLVSLSVMLISISAGLSTGKQASANSDNEVDTKRTLKVLYWNEDDFNRTYGNLFSQKYPNTNIEVVAPAGMEAIKDYDGAIQKYSPDLVMLPPYHYKRLSTDKKLVDLEPLIKRDRYDTTTLYPGLLDELKKQGGGKLYGLSPKADSYALLYNADLFKKYNVKVPNDGMTWEEILNLAQKFPTKGDKNSRIWGLSSFGSSNLVMDIARTEGLTYMDPGTLKATANTTAWKNAYRLASETTKSGALDEGISLSGKSYLESSSFIMGRSAMKVASISQLQSLQAAKSGVKNYKPFTLGIVAGPVAKDRKSTGNVFINEIFAIPADAADVDAAWDFIKYFNGEDYATEYYKSKSSNTSIGAPLSRMIKEYSGYKLDAFYKLKPNLDSSITSYALMNKSPNFELKFRSILLKELTQVVNGKKTLAKATAAIQSGTQAAADKLKKAQTAKK